MFTPYRIRRYDALIFAFISWIIVTGLTIEHILLEGVSSWTRLLALPVLTLLIGILLHEWTSNYNKCRGWIALFLAIGGFVVTLPSSIETLGNAKETSINKKIEYNSEKVRLQEQLIAIETKTNKILPEMINECRGAPNPLPTNPNSWPICRSLTAKVDAYESQRSQIVDLLKNSNPLKPILAGEKSISWFFALFGLQVSAADQIKFSPIVTPIVLEFLVAYFLWLGLETKSQDKPTKKPRARTKEEDEDTLLLEEIKKIPAKAIAQKNSRPRRSIRDALIQALQEPAESNNELAERMGVSPAEASRRVSLAEDIVSKQTSGKYVILRLKDVIDHEPTEETK